jgi:cytochrome P450
VAGPDELDFFSDASLLIDPIPYYQALRGQQPVWREPHHGVVAVSGYDEAVELYRSPELFSNCNAVIGPFGLPFEPPGAGVDDVDHLIERHREQFPMYEHLVTQDPPRHTMHRSLLKRLFTPRRLTENEDFMWRLADRQIEEFHDRGGCELVGEYARPFALLVIADLLGVPAEHHDRFRVVLGAQQPGAMRAEEGFTGNPLTFLDDWFTAAVQERRREPRADVLTSLAAATFPDGSEPAVADVARQATFLFAAGQDTTAKLLTSAMLILAERPDLQQRVRADRALIPTFVEEVLRLESPVKADFRMARSSTALGGVEIPAGSTVMVLTGAVNRDPDRFSEPDEFRLDRANGKEHLAFGRGAHTCPGGPLARVEARVSIERLLDRMADIHIAEAEHGPAGARRFSYEPTYILRGLSALHLRYTPTG